VDSVDAKSERESQGAWLLAFKKGAASDPFWV